MKKINKVALILLMFLLTNPAMANRSDSEKAINQAQVLIESAERNGAQTNATYLLKSARDGLVRAKMYLDERDWVDAEIAAKRAQRDAEVADAKSLSLKAEKSYNDLKTSVDILKAELVRKRGGQ